MTSCDHLSWLLLIPPLKPLFPCLQLVIAALKCHKYDKSIQVTGSAALFYLTNTEYRSDQSVRLRREVIQVVLNGMEHYQEVTVSLISSQWPSSCINKLSRVLWSVATLTELKQKGRFCVMWSSKTFSCVFTVGLRCVFRTGGRIGRSERA